MIYKPQQKYYCDYQNNTDLLFFYSGEYLWKVQKMKRKCTCNNTIVLILFVFESTFLYYMIIFLLQLYRETFLQAIAEICPCNLFGRFRYCLWKFWNFMVFIKKSLFYNVSIQKNVFDFYSENIWLVLGESDWFSCILIFWWNI